MVQCPQCGTENSDGSYYCNNCGTDLTAAGGQQAGGAVAGGQQAGGTEQQHPNEMDRRQQQGRGQRQPGGGGPGQLAGASGAGRPKEQSRRNILLAGGGVVAAAAGGWYFFSRDSDSGGGGDKEEIRAVIQTQYQAFENGNIEQYMGTMHPDSPVYDATQRQLESMFEQIPPETLTVELTIESIEMLSEERAEAEVVQTTRADSEDFRDNRINQVLDMRTYQGEWLLYNSTVNDTEYLG